VVKEKRLTIKQVSEIKQIPIPTLKLLCREGRIPGAKLENTPFGSDFWTIPESSLDHIHLRGRGRPPSRKGVKK
jgi:hypothetical protein